LQQHPLRSAQKTHRNVNVLRERAGVITVVSQDTGAESVEKAGRTLEKSTFLANFFSAFLLL